MKKISTIFQMVIISLVFTLSPSLYAYDVNPESFGEFNQYPPILKKEIQKKMNSIEALMRSIENMKSSISQMRNEIKTDNKKSSLDQTKKESKRTTLQRKIPQVSTRTVQKLNSKTGGQVSDKSDCTVYLAKISDLMLTIQYCSQQLEKIRIRIDDIKKDYQERKNNLTDDEIRAFEDTLSEVLMEMQKILDDIERIEKDIKSLEMAFQLCTEKKPLSTKVIKDYEKKLKAIQIKEIQVKKK